MKEKPVLIIGPLPPPYGGATVSFRLFLDYIVEKSPKVIKHINLPIYKNPEIGKANHAKTVLGVLRAVFFIPFSSKVIIFGSRNFAFFYSLIFILICKCMAKKCSVRFFGGRPMITLIKRNAIIRYTVLMIFRLADQILLQTEIGASEFPEYLQNKIIVVPGYRIINPRNRTAQKHDENIIKFIYAGDVNNEKGINILINAFSEIKIMETHKLIELHLYGNGTEELMLKAQKIDGIHYHGHITNSSLRKLLPSHDIFVFPSLYGNEGHSGSIIEALMAGLPIIATDLPGTMEILSHNQDALIVKSGDVQELINAMVRLSCDPDLRQCLSEASLRICGRFDADNVVPLLANTLEIN